MTATPSTPEVRAVLEKSNQVVGRLITLEVDLELGAKRDDGEGRPLSREDLKLIEKTRETLRGLEKELRDAHADYRQAVRANMTAFDEVQSSLSDLSSKSELVDGLLDAVGIAVAAGPVLVLGATALFGAAAVAGTTAVVVGGAAAVGGFVVSAVRREETGDLTADAVSGAVGMIDDVTKAVGPEGVQRLLANQGLPRLGTALAAGSGRFLSSSLPVVGLASAGIEAFGFDAIGVAPSSGANITYSQLSGETTRQTVERVRGEVGRAGIFTGSEQERAQSALTRFVGTGDDMERAARRLLRAAQRHAHFLKYAFDTWVTDS